MLITINSIPSFAQVGDTLTCYNNAELKRIAKRIVYANECDTLLKIAYSTISTKDSIISNQNLIILSKDTTIDLITQNYDDCQQINVVKTEQMTDITRELRRVKREYRIVTISLATVILLLLL